MAAVEALSFVDAEKVINAWAAGDGPTDEEKIKYFDEVTRQLNDDEQVQKFTENVKQVGTWANQIDASFDRVTRSFEEMVQKYGSDFPGLSNYKDEWVGYNKRWVDNLNLSRTVASEHIAILRRFDKVFLDMVESIVSDQDRLDVIVELQQFIDEKHDKSAEMSQAFFDLKRDIVDFVVRLDKYIVDKGVELEELAKQLKLDIEGIQNEIDVLDKKIKDATIALAAMGGCLNLIGVIAAGSALAVYQSQRNDKAKELQTKQAELADVNRRQVALAHLKSDFDGVKPDIALICEKLLLFAEIWSSVRNQSVQFREHLKGGTGAETNMRFKKEVRLARDVCGPLEAGLNKYATELENRKT